ncbi:cadherin EGF LAG seven-pass G-type receptor 2 [Dermacentor silvarum]|uniref:cadherin EGF LAG seven-pass G-type receptor 2 n=1 Tax=Dermacentor silvarum TaxID=543639 RepID=UPI002101925D|nr:cadherin EGF LAG seven-pass G-type receptor 2 [Dermacentor silvarum]
MIECSVCRGPFGLTAMLRLVGLLLLCQHAGARRGVLVFWSPFHDPRVHENAPAGVHVTTVRALDESSPGKPVAYSLLDVKDSTYFHLNYLTGNLTTARPITRKVGEKYEVIVAAVSQGVTEVKTMQIEVTVPNEYPPRFEHPVYRAEVHQTRTRPGYRVLQVRAHDPDPVPYNAEVYYRLDAGPESTRALKYLALDGITGEVTLNRSLTDVADAVIAFTVVAEDGGSPMKEDRARVEILVKTISDPQNTRAVVVNETSVRICWQRPLYGNVSGYVVKYRAASENVTSFVNVTTGATDKCVPVHGLRPWTDYEYRVHAWNGREEGIGSPVDRFATRIDYCLLNVCKHGSCEATEERPGYRCVCDPGFYGDACEHFDPCSENPCKTFGTCVNTSHGEYRCDCFTGFSGRNCSDFNPCLLKPSACLHGGACESNASHTFTCLCVDGYYGKTCHQYDPCFSSPCLHGARCLNESDVKFSCQCLPGYAGDLCEENINECLSSPCKNRGDCEDGINSFTCHCTPGYGGSLCELRDTCPEELQQTDKGTFHWQPVPHGSVAKIECPYGAYNPASEYKYARRKCRLLADGQTSWMKVTAQHCRYKSFQAAENITSELEFLTHDPRNIRPDQLLDFADKIEPIVDYAIKDIKIAQAMIHVISNFLALNDSVIEEGDANGVAVEKLVAVVERFTSEVVLGPGALIIENENLVVKAVAWSPKLLSQGQDFLSFSLRSNGDHYMHEDFSGDGDEQDDGNNIVITIPFEALSMAINSSLVAAGEAYRPIHEVEKGPRIAFISYRNDKFFRPARYGLASLVSTGQVVLSARIGDHKIENLTDPLIYSYPTYNADRYICAFWDERRKEWSTTGVTTNRSGNVTVCSSTHMTAFSLLLDPLPGTSLAPHHYRILSLISYVGCIMSIVGLFFTILTYSIFRCLNKDRSGKILLNLCTAMLLLNVAFLLGSLQQRFPRFELCLGTAAATHYFLLACLTWMGVEAANMYQMLVHVFASSETCFMLKRVLIAWGIPAAIVGTCLAIDLEPYRSQDDYCVISSRNPFIYYIAFLGISCFILFVNLLVFIMVTRVLFKPRMAGANTKAAANHNSSSASGPGAANSLPITAAQVRGAFTVMTLLGVTWIFGVFAVGEARTVFQYVFCVCNSMQGFLIFVVRVLQYPEARAAWSQLATTGTFKKNRGSGPQAASWCAYSNPKRNSHSSMVRVTSNSTDSTSTVVFNSNMWNKGTGSGGPAGARGDCPSRLSRFSSVGSLLKNCNLQKAEKSTATLNRKDKASSKAIAEEAGAKQNHKEFYSSEDQVTSLVPDLYAGQEHQIKSNSVGVSDPMKYIDDDSRSTVTTLGLGLGSNQKAHILFAYTGGEATPIRVNGVVHSPLDKPKLESFSTFQRSSPVPASTPKIPELPRSWNTAAATVVAGPVDGIVPDHDSLRSSTKMMATEETSFVTPKKASIAVAS